MAFSTLMKISDKTWRFNARFRFGYKFGSNLEETRGGKSSLFWRISGSEWKPWLWATQIQLQRVLSLKVHLHVAHVQPMRHLHLCDRCDRCDSMTCVDAPLLIIESIFWKSKFSTLLCSTDWRIDILFVHFHL